MRPSSYPLLDARDAKTTVLRLTPVLEVEELSVALCAGRVLGIDIAAPNDLPRWPVSAVDGYAIRSADGGGALRVIGESAAGHPFRRALEPGTAARILTGGVMPDGSDSVVMLEEAANDVDMVRVPEGFAAGRNHHLPGSDLRAGEVVLRAGEQLNAAELGLAASMGLATLRVHRRPRVGLLSTGDELVEVGTEPAPGQVVDSNRYALLAALLEAGAEVRTLGPAADEPAQLRRLVMEALEEADVLLTSGGVSVGTHDLVKPLLESIGTVHIGRVKLRPGKPFTFAALPDGKLAFGLPGFPVSSLVTFEVFVRPALRRMQGHNRIERATLPVKLAYDARAAGDRTEYQRVTLARIGDDLVASSTGSQSSSRLLSLAGAHALVRIPPGDQGIEAGSIVEALILSLP